MIDWKVPGTTVRWYFLRGLAVLVFCNFLSLHGQLLGLVGSNGILPIGRIMEQTPVDSAWWGFLNQPVLIWFFHSDTALLTMGYAGMVLAVLLFFDVFPRLVLFLIWFVYFSLMTAGRIFLSYQWDLLVLETVFASIFYAPGNLLPGGNRDKPAGLSVLLMRLVFFKLMVLGGMAKLVGGDKTWWSLTALNYHFETQPLPTPLAWYADKTPVVLLKIGVLFTLFVEIIVPFCVFLKQNWRLIGTGLIVLFQFCIILTGNYGVFNFLSILLGLPVLVDDQLHRLLGNLRSYIPEPSVNEDAVGLPSGWIHGVCVALMIFANIIVFLSFFNASPVPGFARPAWNYFRQLRIVNRYGLFADMTTVRREIVVQGSRDGRVWKTYDFAYKPGLPDQGPRYVAPYMPRLDWQMWFAALKPPNRVRWFPSFLRRLLEGSKPVTNLLGTNPFPRDPPQFVRAIMYRYEFTASGDRWWTRRGKRRYVPVVTLRDGELERVKFRSF